MVDIPDIPGDESFAEYINEIKASQERSHMLTCGEDIGSGCDDVEGRDPRGKGSGKDRPIEWRYVD